MIQKKINKIVLGLSILMLLTGNGWGLRPSGGEFLDVSYKTVNGQTLAVDIYLPDTSVPSPVVIFTHGGGWSAGDKSDVRAGNISTVAQNLLDAGVAVVSVQYRLANDGSIISNCIIDSKDAIHFITKNATIYNIDPTRMAMFGASAGGQIAMMNAVTANDEPAFPRVLLNWRLIITSRLKDVLPGMVQSASVKWT